VLSVNGNIAPVSGTVLVSVPGGGGFVPLTSLRQVPFGTIVDATNGTAAITTAAPHGGTQTGQFFEGSFVLTQGHSGVAVTKLVGGRFSVCPTKRHRGRRVRRGHRGRRAETSTRHASGKHVVRKLWANAHGSFSTQGNYAVGAVQGTEWLTEDLCEGTLIRVTRHRVKVTDLVRHRSHIVKAGHSILIRP